MTVRCTGAGQAEIYLRNDIIFAHTACDLVACLILTDQNKS